MEELTPHIQELQRVLGDKIDEEQLASELNKYLNEYHVNIDAAKRGIIRKYGGNDTATFVTGNALVKKISELTGTEQNVDITAKVVFVDNKEITVKGLPKQIISGILGDETGTASFTVWEPGALVLAKGSVYHFRNCYCKTWNDKVQVNLGNRGRVEPADGVKMELPERQISAASSEVKIGKIKEGMGNVTVTGKIVSVEAKEITARGEQKTVYSGIIADDTGKIQFSAWSDFGLKEGESVCISNAYIRGWKGIPQLNMGDRCEISRVDEVTNVVDTSANQKTVDEITRIGGGLDITLEGLVVDVRQGSGIIRRCPQCNRSMLNGACTTHGAVEGVMDLRLKVVLDDGTGAISAIINKNDTEKLTGVTLQAARGLAAVQGEGVVGREMTSKILMKRIRVVGNVMSDDYGPSIIVKSAESVGVNIEAEANKLLDEVEAAI
ncbi:MAG: single-stranded DNA-binding protein [Candidatus Methanomethylophilaceae archaeon]|nr:single-stranded DNA-binding protein [Candidatus Methanomethylophilaceae archaeon]